MMLGGRYEVGMRLAKGGFGEVFAGAAVGDFGFRRAVAVKVLETPNPAELALAQRLQHPNIVEVLDLLAEDGRVYIVMELADAGSLGDLLGRGPLPVPVAAYVADQVLGALVAAHAAGVVAHRDVNPHNVLLWADGRVKLADFGIAKAVGVDAEPTRSGFVKGKLSYLAPEQIRQETVDGRTDLWALGVMLYELVAGRRPFERGTRSDAEMLAEIARAQEPDLSDLSLPPWFLHVLEGLLEPLPSNRWASASIARVALAAAYGEWSDGREQLVAAIEDVRGQKNAPAAAWAPTRNTRRGSGARPPQVPPASSEVIVLDEVVASSPATSGSAAASKDLPARVAGEGSSRRGLWAVVGLLTVLVVGLAGALARDLWSREAHAQVSPPPVFTVERRSAPLETVQPARVERRARPPKQRDVPEPEKTRPRPVLGPEFFEPGGTLPVE